MSSSEILAEVVSLASSLQDVALSILGAGIALGVAHRLIVWIRGAAR